MKVDFNIPKIEFGVDEETRKSFNEYTEAQKRGSKKLHRIEIDEYTKNVANGLIAVGVLGIICATAVKIVDIVMSEK